MFLVQDASETQIQQILDRAKADCMRIYNDLEELNPRKESVQPQLDQIGRMFNVYIDYDEKWDRFHGKQAVLDENTSKELMELRGEICKYFEV